MFRQARSLCFYPCGISPWECKEVQEVSSLCSVSREPPLSPDLILPTPPPTSHHSIPPSPPRCSAPRRLDRQLRVTFESSQMRQTVRRDQPNRCSCLLPMWFRSMCSAEYGGFGARTMHDFANPFSAFLDFCLSLASIRSLCSNKEYGPACFANWANGPNA